MEEWQKVLINEARATRLAVESLLGFYAVSGAGLTVEQVDAFESSYQKRLELIFHPEAAQGQSAASTPEGRCGADVVVKS